MDQSIVSSVADDFGFHVSVPTVRQLEEKQESADAGQAASSMSSWLGGYVSLPPMLGGGSAAKTYTAYHIVTIFDKSAADGQQFEVDRRFSDFEKLLTHLRQLPNQPIVPDLPKKRFFNSSEQIIEQRRTELEKFLVTLLRSREMREYSAVKYFLTRQEGLEVFLGNVSRYDWAHQALHSLDPKYFSLDMLKAVAKIEIENRGSEIGASEPLQLMIKIPDFKDQADFLADLEDRLEKLKNLRDLFSAQAKISEAESSHIN